MDLQTGSGQEFLTTCVCVFRKWIFDMIRQTQTAVNTETGIKVTVDSPGMETVWIFKSEIS